MVHLRLSSLCSAGLGSAEITGVFTMESDETSGSLSRRKNLFLRYPRHQRNLLKHRKMEQNGGVRV